MSMKQMKTLTINEEQFEIMDEYARNNCSGNNGNNASVGNNLLINSNFANPVNQRGYAGEVTTKSMYTIDRWKMNAGQSFDVSSNGITFKEASTTGYFVQRIEASSLKGKIVTLSMKINRKVHLLSAVVSEENISSSMSVDEYSHIYLDYDISNDIVTCGLSFYNGATPTIEWAKLELGEVATPYVPRLYGEELLLCKRYYKKVYLGDANLWQIQTDYLAYCMSLGDEMRVVPTITFPTDGSTALAKNGVVQNGFSFEAIDVLATQFGIKVSKSSHGLSTNDLPTIRRYAYADAEL